MSNNLSTAEQIAERIRAQQALEAIDKVAKTGLYQQTSSGADIITGDDGRDRDDKKYRHDTSGPKKEGRDAIFMFPESYNQLRKELHDHWPNLWAAVSWRMAYRAEEFVEQMNAALDVAVVFDTEKVDFISTTYLNLLRKKRGVSPI